MALKACANDMGDAKASEGMGSKYPPHYPLRYYAKWAMKRLRRNTEKQELRKEVNEAANLLAPPAARGGKDEERIMEGTR